MKTFLGFGQDYVEGYYKKTGFAVFLHIHREKIEIQGSTDVQSDGPEKKITRLAIGVEGGFDPNENKRNYEYRDHLSIVVFPEAVKMPYPNIDLPLLVSSADRNVIFSTKKKNSFHSCTEDVERKTFSIFYVFGIETSNFNKY